MLRWASMHLGSRHPLFPGQSFAIQLGPCSRISSPLAQKREACPNPKRYPIYQPGDGAYDESSHHNLHHLLRLLLRSRPSKGTCCSIVTEQKRKSRLRLGLAMAMAMAITAHWHLLRSSLAVRPGVLCMYEMHIPNTQFHSSGTCVPAHAR